MINLGFDISKQEFQHLKQGVAERTAKIFAC